MPTRRQFLQGAAAVPFAPVLSQGSWAHWLPCGDDRVLCVLELIGGNDGLNTVIPTDDARYARARPRLAAVRRGAHGIGDGHALHPALGRLALRFRDGAAAVHSVGYPQPDRSHFRSRDIWHAADPELQRVAAGTTGWLGRAADQLAGQGAGMPAAAVGAQQLPLLLQAARVVVPVIERIEDFALQAPGAGEPRGFAGGAPAALGGAAPGDFVAGTIAAALRMADRLQQAMQRYRPAVEYPATGLGNDLQLAARMAVAGFGTRLLHVGLSGFDTHAQQLPAHQSLLAQLDGALESFAQDLQAHGLFDRTVVFVHSEFGRRIAENQSQGTDHGAGAPVFLLGGSVRPGLHGQPPDLDDALDGDVRPTTDFRAVYAALLRWLGLEPEPLLAHRVAPLDLLR